MEHVRRGLFQVELAGCAAGYLSADREEEPRTTPRWAAVNGDGKTGGRSGLLSHSSGRLGEPPRRGDRVSEIYYGSPGRSSFVICGVSAKGKVLKSRKKMPGQVLG